jgi:hypothetical protein
MTVITGFMVFDMVGLVFLKLTVIRQEREYNGNGRGGQLRRTAQPGSSEIGNWKWP